MKIKDLSLNQVIELIKIISYDGDTYFKGKGNGEVMIVQEKIILTNKTM